MDNTGIKNVGQINIAENGGHINVYNVNKNTPKVPADFSSYYDNIKRKFTREKRGADAEIVGAYSDEEAYIDAYIKVHKDVIPVLSYLEKWFCKDTFGTLLIHGEPGHGKTSLCNKAVFEYGEGRFLNNKATNVLMVSLNIGDNPKIICDGMVVLKNALTWVGMDKPFTFEDCRGALLFMDGYDELIDEAKKANIKDIVSFMKLITEIADTYDIHIVVLSRTIAVESYLKESGVAGKSYKLLPITNEQQNNWFYQHSEYDDYKETFYRLRENEDMQELFEIPFLFRLIVHSRFDEISTNVVELYEKLFKHIMSKRNIYEPDLDMANFGLKNLAYDIYCDDTDTAAVDKKDSTKQWIIVFSLKMPQKGRVGFYHRSFYQYFLARFIYDGILKLTDDQVETYISYFAERELDSTVCQYLSLMLKEAEKETVYFNLKLAIDALVRTEAYLGFKPRCSSGNAEKKRILRSVNIFHNLLRICAVLDYVISIPFKDNIDIFLRIYPCSNIRFCSNDNQRVNLNEANLSGANLIRADLRGANLSGAVLGGAFLSGTILGGAFLSGADLSGADLSRADLSRADLSGADLIEANLIRADLRGANLSGADLSGADLSGAFLNGADLNGAYLGEACLTEANLSRANLSGVNLSSTELSKVNLSEVNLSKELQGKVVLSGIDLSEANLIRADLRGVDLSNADLSKAVLQKANLSGGYLRKAKLSRTNLSGSDLRKVDLNGADLREADLSRADLREADLREADLSGADLSGANLSEVYLSVSLDKGLKLKTYLNGANLTKAYLIKADLSGADLSGADLSRADLREADLSRADLSRANLSGANLFTANLKGAIFGLCCMDNMIINYENKKYIDPSVKGYETIQWY